MTPDLPLQLAVSAGMFVLTILVHLLGLMGLLQLGRRHATDWRTPWLSLDRLLVPMTLALGLSAIHAVEVGLYAVLYLELGATATLEQAIFYSAASYSTAGFAGLELNPKWRVLVALESLNGIILLGWSTAFLFQGLHRLLHAEGDHPFPAGAIARASPRPSRSGKGAPSGTNSSDTELMQ